MNISCQARIFLPFLLPCVSIKVSFCALVSALLTRSTTFRAYKRRNCNSALEWENFFHLSARLPSTPSFVSKCVHADLTLSAPSHVSVPREFSSEIDIGKMGFRFLLFSPPQKQRKPSQQVKLVFPQWGILAASLFPFAVRFALLLCSSALPTLLVSSLTHHSNCSDCR